MKLLDEYKSLKEELFKYFGYVEGWRVLPIDDAREYFWRLYGEGPGTVYFAETKEQLDDEYGSYYTNEIYTQRHLPKWVYIGVDYTMIVVDTTTDGNKFLQIFDNSKRVR